MGKSKSSLTGKIMELLNHKRFHAIQVRKRGPKWQVEIDGGQTTVYGSCLRQAVEDALYEVRLEEYKERKAPNE